MVSIALVSLLIVTCGVGLIYHAYQHLFTVKVKLHTVDLYEH